MSNEMKKIDWSISVVQKRTIDRYLHITFSLQVEGFALESSYFLTEFGLDNEI